MTLGRLTAILCLIMLLCFSVIGGVYVANSFSSSLNPALTEDGDVITADSPYGDRVNVLVMGKDAGLRTDTMILFQLNLKEKSIKTLSIPRDTRVMLHGNYNKINAAFGFNDREKSSMNAVKSLTGLSVNYYVTVDNTGFRAIIDYLGGVEIDVPRDMKYSDPVQGLNINLKKGRQVLDGNKSEQFVRYRSGYAEGDIGRIHAQQIFLKELLKQKLTLGNIARSKSIFEEVKKYISTNYTIGTLVSHVNKLKDINTEVVQTFEIPGEPRMISGISYWIADTVKLNELMNEHFLP